MGTIWAQFKLGRRAGPGGLRAVMLAQRTDQRNAIRQSSRSKPAGSCLQVAAEIFRSRMTLETP